MQKINPITFFALVVPVALSIALNCQAEDLKTIIVKPTNYKVQPITEKSKAGKVLFTQMNCASCHSIDREGGCLGPPLSGVGAFRQKDFLLARLTDTQEAKNRFQAEYSYHAELMPHPRFAPDIASKLVSYLLTLPVPEGGFAVQKHAGTTSSKNKGNAVMEASASDILDGGRNFYKFGCISCHSIGNVGGSLAPALDEVGSRRDIDYIRDHITDAQFHNKMVEANSEKNPSKMPHFKATEKEIDQIAAFLYTLRSKK